LRYKRPDKKNALSIIEAAKRDMKFTLSLKVNEESAATIARNIYECFRMLGDSIMVAEGMQSEDHITPIKELMKINVITLRPINLIENLRGLRHNINYYGYRPSLDEIKDVISVANSLFEPLYDAIKDKIMK